jgi:hypothetical protein
LSEDWTHRFDALGKTRSAKARMPSTSISSSSLAWRSICVIADNWLQLDPFAGAGKAIWPLIV